MARSATPRAAEPKSKLLTPVGLLGHHQAREVLGRAAIEGRPAQAYVFSGAEGVGKRACGLWFARLLLCNGRGPNDREPCDACIACRKVVSGSHPDVVEVGLLEKKATIGVEQARELQGATRFAPMEGEWKIFLLVEAHRFTEQAMNCLLKTLEEPQPRRVFVLMTPTHGAMLPTILSRCQLIRFAPLQPAEVAGWLMGLGTEADRAALCGALSEGRPGMAWRMAGDARLWDFRIKVLEQVAQLTRDDGSHLMDIAEKLEALGGTDRKLAFERALEMTTMWFRDLVWLQRGLDPARLLNGDQIEPLRAAAERYGYEAAMRALAALREAREQMTHNVNAKLMFTRLVLRLRP